MTAHPEHALQTLVCKLVREIVPQPCLFTSIDRSAKQSAFQHMREASRGILSGFPDCILLVPGMPVIAVELKAPGSKPSERQRAVEEAILASGHHYAWADSVQGYVALLRGFGVPLADRADDPCARVGHRLAVRVGRADRGRVVPGDGPPAVLGGQAR